MESGCDVKLSISRWIVGASLVFVVVASQPALAQSAEEGKAAVDAALVEPAAGTDIYIPIDIFLEHLDREPTLVETLVDRLRNVRSAVARTLGASRSDETDLGIDLTTDTLPPVLDVAAELGSQVPVEADQARELVERMRDEEMSRAETTAREMLAARLARELSAFRSDNANAATAALPSSTSYAAQAPNDGHSLSDVREGIAEAIFWIRDQPFVLVVALSLLGLVFWMRHAVHRVN